jgi:hypothetical protein
MRDLSIHNLTNTTGVLIDIGYLTLDSITNFITNQGTVACAGIIDGVITGTALFWNVVTCFTLTPLGMMLILAKFILIRLVPPEPASQEHLKTIWSPWMNQHGYENITMMTVDSPRDLGYDFDLDGFAVEYILADHIDGYTTMFSGGHSYQELLSLIKSGDNSKGSYFSHSYRTKKVDQHTFEDAIEEVPEFADQLFTGKFLDNLLSEDICVTNFIQQEDNIIGVWGQFHINGFGGISQSCLPHP